MSLSIAPAPVPESSTFSEAPLPPGTPEELAGLPEPPIFAPVSREERIGSMDVLRGFALMGILLMNITSFGLPGWAYAVPLGTLLPVFSGPHARINTLAWMLRWVLAEGKMRAMFSMLFGAGVILLTERAERRGAGARVADIFLRRNMWLVLLGALHGYLVWYGDILFWYGTTALLFLFPMRHLQPRTLIKAAGWLLLAWVLIAGVVRNVGVWQTEKKGREAIAAAHAGKVLSQDQKDAIGAKVKQDTNWWHLTADVQKNVDSMHKGYLAAQAHDAKEEFESATAIYFAFADVLIFMMLGMALYKNGFLTLELPTSVYVKTAVIGYAVSLPLGIAGAVESWRCGFEIVRTSFWLQAPYDICRVAGALANAALILLLLRAGLFRWFMARVAAVGQMALSNYLLTSITCRFLFVWGPTHWYGYMEYYKLYLVVLCMWIVNLTWSTLWLRHYLFGPVEWLWRSLTYWKRQPMRIPGTRHSASAALLI